MEMGCVWEESVQERWCKYEQNKFCEIHNGIIKLVTEYRGRKGALKIKVYLHLHFLFI